jgi:hypothetical protein
MYAVKVQAMTGPLFHVLKMVRDIELLVLEALDHLTSYSFLKVLLALTPRRLQLLAAMMSSSIL